MARGKIDIPNLDDRTWQDLVNQTKALIPHYAPEWTDHNPSDLGITLIELFAWLVEQMIYRLNRVPEKNYIAFLNLLGITRDPPTPASTWVTFKTGGDKPVTIQKGCQVATQPKSPADELIIFETDTDLEVVPADLVAAYYTNKKGKLLAAPIGLAGIKMQIPATQGTGSVGEQRIVLGFDINLNPKIKLLMRFARPLSNGSTTWQYLCLGKWVSVDPISDNTDSFTRSGIVSFLPLHLWKPEELPKANARKCCWIQVALDHSGSEDLTLELEHLLFNSVAATNALTVNEEVVGLSDGTPYQHFELKHRPLYKQPSQRPYEHVAVEIREEIPGGEWETWSWLDDLPAEAGDFYRLNPVTGTIMFGDGVHGRIPPAGSEIRATYRYVVAGGAKGNVKAGAISALFSSDLKSSGIVSVENLVDARGGKDEESIEEAKRRAPELLRIRNRTITLEDYEYLAREASPNIAKVRCLGPNAEMNGQGNLDRSPGEVNVIIVPEKIDKDKPVPSPELILTTQCYLDARRPLTSHITVVGPRYLPIDVEMSIKVWKDAEFDGKVSTSELETNILASVTEFLHPITGGEPKGLGWQVGQHVMVADLLQVVQRAVDSSIGFIESLVLKAGATLHSRPKALSKNLSERVWVQLEDFEIACSGLHNVEVSVLK